MEKVAAKTLEVIIKITERCNINCTYCYMFNLGNNDYEEHDAVIRSDTIDSLVAFLDRGLTELATEHLIIVFHGGEPLLMKKHKFADLCNRLQATLAAKVKTFQLYVQTNAMLIDDDWIAIFEKFRVHIERWLHKFRQQLR